MELHQKHLLMFSQGAWVDQDEELLMSWKAPTDQQYAAWGISVTSFSVLSASFSCLIDSSLFDDKIACCLWVYPWCFSFSTVTSIFTKTAGVHETADPKQLIDECVYISHIISYWNGICFFEKEFLERTCFFWKRMRNFLLWSLKYRGGLTNVSCSTLWMLKGSGIAFAKG